MLVLGASFSALEFATLLFCRVAPASKIEAEFFFNRCPICARFSAVALFGTGQFAAVVQILQRVAQFAQHGFGLLNLAVNIRPVCRAAFAFDGGRAHL